MSTILIVDDAQELAELFMHIFKSKGYDVKTASSREQALNVVSSTSINVILMDVKLAGENGREICKELKNHNDYCAIPVILISANREMLEDYQECGADYAIEKPFELDTLLSTVQLHIIKHQNRVNT
ncbi:MAG: response regulator [Ferruginibacter sp.]